MRPPVPRIAAFADWPLHLPGEALHVTIERTRKLQQYHRLFRSAIVPIKLSPEAATGTIRWASDEEIELVSRNTLPLGRCRLVLASAESSSACLRCVLAESPLALVLCDDLSRVEVEMEAEAEVGAACLVAEPTEDFVAAARDFESLVIYDCTTLSETWMAAIFASLAKGHAVTVIAAPDNTRLAMLARALTFMLCKAAHEATDGSATLKALETFFSNFGEIRRAAAVVSGTSRLHYRLPTTGAMLLPSNSIQLLLAVCSYIPKMAGYARLRIRTMAVKRVSAEGVVLDKERHFFVTQITLPAILASEQLAVLEENQLQIRGLTATNRFMACTTAASEALKRLHDAGILDDNFIPVERIIDVSPVGFVRPHEDQAGDNDGDDTTNNVEGVKDAETFDDEDTAGETMGTALIKEIVADELQFDDSWRAVGEALTEAEASFEYYMVVFEYCTVLQDPEDPEDQAKLAAMRLPCDSLIHYTDLNFFNANASKRSVAILLPKRLQPDLHDIVINLGAYLNVRGRPSAVLAVVLSKRQMERLLEFQLFLFGALNPHSLGGPYDGGDDDTNDDDDNDNDDHELRKQFVVPDDKKSTFLAAIVKRADAPPIHWTTDLELTRMLYRKFVTNAAELGGASILQPEATQGGAWEIDWEIVNVVLDQDKYPSLGDLADQLQLQVERVDEEAPAFITLPEKPPTVVDFRLFALRRMVVYAPWNGMVYRIKRWRPELCPASPFASNLFPQCACYADYMPLRYGVEVREASRPGMAETKRVENFMNISKWVARIDRAKSRRRRRRESPSLIIPEIARVVPLPYGMLRVVLLLPRVVADLEGQLLAVQCFRDQYDTLHSVWPSTRVMIEAMTGVAAATTYNYERLEILGDSVLKLFTTLDIFMSERFSGEGKLSRKRQERISNYNLIVQGNALKISLYARLTPYNARLFAPPAIATLLEMDRMMLRWPFAHRLFDDGACRWKRVQALDVRAERRFALFHLYPDGRLVDTQQTAHDPTQRRHRGGATSKLPVVTRFGRPVPPKSLADILEAQIAAFYLGPAGLEGAMEFLIRAGLCSERVRHYRNVRDVVSVAGALLADTEADAAGAVPTRLVSAQPDMSIIHPAPFIPDEDRFPYEELEALLGHRFVNRRLLFLAVTHPSVDISHSYERLEWLGDAALDWIVTRYYWEGFGDHRWMTPARITQARQTAVCNEAFARISAQHGLHRFLRISAPSLQLEIADFVQRCEAATAETARHGELPPAPKALGDLFESIAGALFLDLHFDIGACESLLLPLLGHFLTHHADPYDLPDQPLHEFWHAMRIAGYAAHVTFRFENPSDHLATCRIAVKGRIIAEASGPNRMFARINACRLAVAFVEEQDGWRDLGQPRG